MTAKTVPISWYQDPCNEDPSNTYQTVRAGHLFLIYTAVLPIQRTRWITVRGVPRACGFYSDIAPLGCLEQLQDGDTFYHSWLLPTFPPGTILYYAITDDCDVSLRTTTTPVIVYTYSECPANANNVRVGRRFTQFVSTSGGRMNYGDFVWGDPAMATSSGIEMQVAGNYRTEIRCQINPSFGTATWQAQMWNRGAMVILTTQVVTTSPSNSGFVFMQALSYWEAGQDLELRFTRLSGTGTAVCPTTYPASYMTAAFAGP